MSAVFALGEHGNEALHIATAIGHRTVRKPHHCRRQGARSRAAVSCA